MFKSSKVMEKSQLLSHLTECLEFFHDINTDIKIISPMFSPGLFSFLGIPFQTFPSIRFEGTGVLHRGRTV